MPTNNFGLEAFGSDGNFSDNGYKFSLKDREIIDALLFTLYNHDHRATSNTSFEGPTQAPNLTYATSGGSIPAGLTYYYRISYVDASGNETASSVSSAITTPSVLAPPPVMAIGTATTGGSLAPGTYKYAISYTQGTGQTRATNEFSVVVPTGTNTNVNTITLDTLPDGADGWKVYRRAPGEQYYYLLKTIASGATQYVDNGTDSPNCTVFRPNTNTTNSSNTITVSIDANDLPLDSSVVAWRVYRTRTSEFGESSLLVEQSETTTEGGADLVTSYTDTGSSTSFGTPLQVTAVPPNIPQLDAGDIFDSASDPLPSNLYPRGTNYLTVPLLGTLADATTYYQTFLTHDIDIERAEIYYQGADPTGVDGSNYLTVTISDDSLVDEVQSLYNDATPQNEFQYVYNDATAGTFTLTYNGAETTNSLDYDITPANLKTRLETDCASITTVNVAGLGTPSSPWIIEFVNPGNQNVPELTATDSLTGGSTTITTTIQGSDGGTFTLSDGTDTTTAIAYNAAAATIETRLETDITSITDVTVSGTGVSSDPWVITFVNPGDQDLDLLVVNDTNLNGVSYIEETTKGRGNQSVDVVINAAQSLHSFVTSTTDFGAMEAEDATLSGGVQVSDALALNDVAVELDTQNETVTWTVGTLDAGTYKFSAWVAQPDDNSTGSLEINDTTGPTTLATKNIIANAREGYGYLPAYELEVTLDGTENVEFVFTKTDATTDTIRIDKMEYEVILPKLYGGQTMTVAVTVTGTPTTNGDDAILTVCY